MAEQSGGEKTLPASPHKKLKARERGNVPRSQDLNAAWSLLAALGLLSVLGTSMAAGMTGAVRRFVGDAWALSIAPDTARGVAIEAAAYLGYVVVPFMLLLMAAALMVNVAQVGVLVAPQALAPKLERLNPLSGFRKFFTVRTLAELVKSLLKLAVVAYIVYVTLRGRWVEVLAFANLSPWGLVKAMSALVFLVWVRVAAAMLVLGILDYGFQRWQYELDLRMTLQEAREEMRQLEGDPRIRQRVRAIQRQMAMQRMLREVPKAEVVVTNPTTYAVALRYDAASMDAPVVSAKGARLLAERIRALAVEHGVPLVERPELARTLFRTLDVGRPVPETLFRAVAEVLAFVYQVDRREEKRRERLAAGLYRPVPGEKAG